MANVTRDVAFTKTAYTKQSSPNSAFSTNSSTAYSVSTDSGSSNTYKTMYYGGANSWPSSLKRNKIISAQMRIYVKAGGATGISARACANFTPSQVTYANPPSPLTPNAYRTASAAGISIGAWGDIWIPFDEGATAATKSQNTIEMLRNGAVGVDAGYYNADLGGSPWSVRTVLSNNAAPFLRITYSDSDIVTSKVEIVNKLPGSNTYPNQVNSVTWKLVKNSSNYCVDETFVQSSAKFRWRVQGASTWNDINVSGSTMAVNIPAYTFPTGKTIEYCIQCTDTDGTTTTTSTYTTTTPASQITQQNGPTSGYKNPRNAIIFSWYFANVAGDYAQQSASLFWRVSGSDTWTEVQASGSTMSLTVAENTFPTASTIEWYLYGTDSSGSFSQTPVYSFSTSASVITAVCQTPVNTVEDGSAPIPFKWQLYSSDGYAASRTVFMWKKSSDSDIPANWHTEMDVNQTVKAITVLANVFTAGEIDWKVCAYNIDGTEGVWGEASFICVAAPDPVLGLAATPVPLTTISWQSEGQEAYEISIDGEVVQKAFGPGVYSWKVPEPLMEGEHTISVRIQGIYGLWSQPAGTSIQVDGPRSHGVLTADFGVDAHLTHSLISSTVEIRWYRDGVLIATSHGDGVTPAEFTDRRVLGEHSYFARYWWPNGEDYDETNTVTGTMDTGVKLIAPLDDLQTPWLELRLSENSIDAEEYQWSRTNSQQHINGAVWPELERTKFEDLAVSYDVAFRYLSEVKAFEALLGKVVILKSREQNVTIGMLATASKRVGAFYTTFSFLLRQIHTEDFVEVPNP